MSKQPAFHVPPRRPSKEDFNLESFGDLLGQLDKVGAASVAPTPVSPANQPENDTKKRFFRFLRLGF